MMAEALCILGKRFNFVSNLLLNPPHPPGWRRARHAGALLQVQAVVEIKINNESLPV